MSVGVRVTVCMSLQSTSINRGSDTDYIHLHILLCNHVCTTYTHTSIIILYQNQIHDHKR